MPRRRDPKVRRGISMYRDWWEHLKRCAREESSELGIRVGAQTIIEREINAYFRRRAAGQRRRV